ncbi:MAG: hypothetical protein WCG20_02475 [bacterium]
MKKVIEGFGWYGTIAILSAYGLVSFSVLQPTDIWYQVLNGTGALGIVTVAFSKKDYQPVVLNTVWVLIAVIAAIQILI